MEDKDLQDLFYEAVCSYCADRLSEACETFIFTALMHRNRRNTDPDLGAKLTKAAQQILDRDFEALSEMPMDPDQGIRAGLEAVCRRTLHILESADKAEGKVADDS